MKVLKFIAILAILTLTSCGEKTSKQPANAEGFTAIEKEIKAKFGEDAYYTKAVVMYNESIGNMVSVTVTEAPESLKMEEWNLSQNSWKQSSEISLEVPKGTKAADFMFQLNDKINLSKLGELVEKSSKQLTAEKSIENPVLDIAYVSFPKNGDISKADYSINLKPEDGGTTFKFSYRLNGDLIKMDY